MALPIRRLGISPDDLGELIARDRWQQWCTVEPVLGEVAGLHEIRTLRGEQEDSLLGALLRLASAAGGDDSLAAVAVTHLLGGSICSIAKRFWRMTDEDIEEIVTASMWVEIRSFDWRKRTKHYGASLTHATRRAVRRTLTSGHSGSVDGVVVPVDPQTWHFEILAEQVSYHHTDWEDPQQQLDQFLGWARDHGDLSTDDNTDDDAAMQRAMSIGLLLTLVAADRVDVEHALFDGSA